MKIKVKDLKEALKRGELLNEAFMLGQGFKGYQKNKTPKKKKQLKTSQDRAANFMLGDGFLTEGDYVISTKENLVSLVEQTVNDLKGKTDYHGLKFVENIGAKYTLETNHINEIKSIVSQEGSDKKLFKYINECCCRCAKRDYGRYGGLAKPSQEMIPQIKKTFNGYHREKPVGYSIMQTAKDLAVPNTLVDELYEAEVEANQMKNEGRYSKETHNQKLSEIYEKYQKMSEGDLDEMYNEMAEMMGYPKAQEQYISEYEDDGVDYDFDYEPRKKDYSGFLDGIDLDDLGDEEDLDQEREAEFYGDEFMNKTYPNDITEDDEFTKFQRLRSKSPDDIYDDENYFDYQDVDDYRDYENDDDFDEMDFSPRNVGMDVREIMHNIEEDLSEFNESLDTDKQLDPVGQEDADIDNDSDVDSEDAYLLNRRKKISQKVRTDESVDMDIDSLISSF